MHPPYTDEDLAGLAAGDLEGARAWRMRRHFAECAACRAEWDAVQGLWAQAQTARSIEPPAWLPSRLAADLPSPPKPGRRLALWKPLTALGGVAGAAFVATLLTPGSPIRPLPVFADVERAMRQINSIGYSQSDIGVLDGYRRTAQVWVRRNPPAIASQGVIVNPPQPPRTVQTLWAGKQYVYFDKTRRRYSVSRLSQTVATSVSASVKDRLASFLSPQERMIELYPNVSSGITPTPLPPVLSKMNGHNAWKFTWLYLPAGIRPGTKTDSLVSVETVWSDPQTMRVLRAELDQKDATGRTWGVYVEENFRYEAPADAFGLTPPPGVKVTKR